MFILEQKLMEEQKHKLRIDKIRAGAYKENSPVNYSEPGIGELLMYMGAAFAFIAVVCVATIWAVLKYSESEYGSRT